MINDSQRIAHILQAIGKIKEATSCSKEEFLASALKKDAVSYNITDYRRGCKPNI